MQLLKGYFVGNIPDKQYLFDSQQCPKYKLSAKKTG